MMEHTGFNPEAADFVYEVRMNVAYPLIFVDSFCHRTLCNSTYRLFPQNAKNVAVCLVDSQNPNGMLVEANHAISLMNVRPRELQSYTQLKAFKNGNQLYFSYQLGTAPVTFLANLAQDGIVFYSFSEAYNGSQRIIVRFGILPVVWKDYEQNFRFTMLVMTHAIVHPNFS